MMLMVPLFSLYEAVSKLGNIHSDASPQIKGGTTTRLCGM